MNELYLHARTQLALEAILERKPHAVLLGGPEGIGLKTIGLHLAKRLHSTPLLVAPDEKGAISIDQIRLLYRQTSGKKTSSQVVILDDADTITLSGQQAFLKLLEEPTPHTMFVLTSHHPESILGTIMSRLQHVEVLPTSRQQTDKQLAQLRITDPAVRAQMLYLGAGKPAEICRLTSDNEYFEERAAQIRTAKTFLDATPYQKLVTAYKLGSDRDAAMHLLEQCCNILKVHLQKDTKSPQASTLAAFIHALEKLHEDGNVRTQLLRAIIAK